MSVLCCSMKNKIKSKGLKVRNNAASALQRTTNLNDHPNNPIIKNERKSGNSLNNKEIQQAGRERETHKKTWGEKKKRRGTDKVGLVFICNRRPYRELQKAISSISNGALQQFSLSHHSPSQGRFLNENQAGSE